jgi:hypothetical protein
MPRARGNDLCEIFGYAPDDFTEAAQKQRASQLCPFIPTRCIKHSHPQQGQVTVYGSCSVVNKTKNGTEEIIICPQRLYANEYQVLKSIVYDALQTTLPFYTADIFAQYKRVQQLPDEYIVILGHNSGKEIALSNPGFISLSLDWVLAHIVADTVQEIFPCEVQSIDITGNYYANWLAYQQRKKEIPDSEHGMNWANVWKRLIPQIILKGAIASTSALCKYGFYFIVPDRVFRQFEKLVGEVIPLSHAEKGCLTVVTYELGLPVSPGAIRSLVQKRIVRMRLTDFAAAFASGKQLPSGAQLDDAVKRVLESL